MSKETREILNALMDEFRRQAGLLVDVDGIPKKRALRSLSNAQLRKIATFCGQPEQVEKLTHQLYRLGEAAHKAIGRRIVEAQRNLDRNYWAPVKAYNTQLIASGMARPERLRSMAMFKDALEREPHAV